MNPKTIQSIFTKIPVKISMPFVLTLPALGVVLVLSVLAFVQSQTTANDLMAQNLDQIHSQIMFKNASGNHVAKFKLSDLAAMVQTADGSGIAELRQKPFRFRLIGTSLETAPSKVIFVGTSAGIKIKRIL